MLNPGCWSVRENRQSTPEDAVAGGTVWISDIFYGFWSQVGREWRLCLLMGKGVGKGDLRGNVT